MDDAFHSQLLYVQFYKNLHLTVVQKSQKFKVEAGGDILSEW